VRIGVPVARLLHYPPNPATQQPKPTDARDFQTLAEMVMMGSMRSRTSRIIGFGVAALLVGVTTLPNSAFAARARLGANRPSLKQPCADAFKRFDNFGATVAISGAVAVVGAPGVNSNAGLACVYARSRRGWRLQASLKNPEATNQDQFGFAVAVTSGPSGSYALIGTAGTVSYIFVRSGRSWRLQATLKDPHPVATASFGYSVAIAGSLAVVGSPDGYLTIGRAYLYRRSGSSWRLLASFADTGAKSDKGYGQAVALSGTTAVIGDWTAHGYGGAALIYGHRTPGKWRLQAALAGPRGVHQANFGTAVAISGPTAAIGTGVSTVYVFRHLRQKWRRVAKLTEPHGPPHNEFGTAVAVDGTRMLVGDPRPSNRGCAAAYEFRPSGRMWKERAQIFNPGCKRNDWFGGAVSISGRTGLIGAPELDNWSGTAYWLTLP